MINTMRWPDPDASGIRHEQDALLLADGSVLHLATECPLGTAIADARFPHETAVWLIESPRRDKFYTTDDDDLQALVARGATLEPLWMQYRGKRYRGVLARGDRVVFVRARPRFPYLVLSNEGWGHLATEGGYSWCGHLVDPRDPPAPVNVASIGRCLQSGLRVAFRDEPQCWMSLQATIPTGGGHYALTLCASLAVAQGPDPELEYQLERVVRLSWPGAPLDLRAWVHDQVASLSFHEHAELKGYEPYMP